MNLTTNVFKLYHHKYKQQIATYKKKIYVCCCIFCCFTNCKKEWNIQYILFMTFLSFVPSIFGGSALHSTFISIFFLSFIFCVFLASFYMKMRTKQFNLLALVFITIVSYFYLNLNIQFY